MIKNLKHLKNNKNPLNKMLPAVKKTRNKLKNWRLN